MRLHRIRIALLVGLAAKRNSILQSLGQSLQLVHVYLIQGRLDTIITIILKRPF